MGLSLLLFCLVKSRKGRRTQIIVFCIIVIGWKISDVVVFKSFLYKIFWLDFTYLMSVSNSKIKVCTYLNFTINDRYSALLLNYQTTQKWSFSFSQVLRCKVRTAVDIVIDIYEEEWAKVTLSFLIFPSSIVHRYHCV